MLHIFVHLKLFSPQSHVYDILGQKFEMNRKNAFVTVETS